MVTCYTLGLRSADVTLNRPLCSTCGASGTSSTAQKRIRIEGSTRITCRQMSRWEVTEISLCAIQWSTVAPLCLISTLLKLPAEVSQVAFKIQVHRARASKSMEHVEIEKPLKTSTQNAYLSASDTILFGEKVLSGITEPLKYFFCSEVTCRGKEVFCATVSSSFAVWARDPMEAFVKSCCCPEFTRFASFQSGVVALSSSSPISKQPLHHSTGSIKINPSFKTENVVA